MDAFTIGNFLYLVSLLIKLESIYIILARKSDIVRMKIITVSIVILFVSEA